METIKNGRKVGRYHLLEQFGEVGDVSTFHTDVDIPRKEAAWLGVMLEGSWELTTKPASVGDWPVLRAGMHTGMLPDNLAGDYQYTVREKVHYLCLTCDDGSAPNAQAISKQAGESMLLPQGKLFALGKGRITINGEVFSGVHVVIARNTDVPITFNEASLGIVADI
jgi:hypothetical protein